MATPSNHQNYEKQDVRVPNEKKDSLSKTELQRRLKAAIDEHLFNAFVMSLDDVSFIGHDDATGEDVYQVSYTTYKGNKYSSG